MRKSWKDKLADDKNLPRVFQVPGEMARRFGAGMMVIPAPREVDALMKRVPKGRVVTINELRSAVASRHQADMACPITTGIFSWIAAHAAAEASSLGSKRITPYWRTLKNGGEVNPKYPGGLEEVSKRLRAECHEIEKRGKRAYVVDFTNVLVSGKRLLGASGSSRKPMPRSGKRA
ncbi:MAG TPA: hypothetical protein VEH04_18000 [Verrucomicrobiae bacterium]|nr:hypothetical protein [Verrucomicrobiae bacterium]